jgi:dTDP-4-dehydrorhamnose reductase
MNVLVLGATGMLGHKLIQVLANRFDVTGTVRGDVSDYRGHPVLGKMPLVGDVQVQDLESIVRVIAHVHPTVIINGIGLVKQLELAKDPLPSLTVNALFPHRLAQLCQAADIRLIHISTDCVFSGRRGNYTEDDVSDAEDLYGRTKFLGEVSGPGCLTLRTSIIGRELQTSSGLIEWFLSQRGGAISGYAKAIYTGFTTQALAELIGEIVERHPALSGVWQVSSEPISKYDLLQMVNCALDLGIQIRKDETFVCNRSLASARFRTVTGLTPPTWHAMIAQMAQDPTPYDEMRKRNAH